MRYLHNVVIKLPRPVKREDTQEDATFPFILKRIMENYTPTDKLRLTLKDIRVLNRAIDALDKEPKDGFYALETDEFDIVHRVLEYLGPALLGGTVRNMPALLDALDDCPQIMPGSDIGNKVEEATAPESNGHTPQPALAKVKGKKR